MLRDGAASLDPSAGEKTLHRGTQDTGDADAPLPAVEVLVFGGDHRLLERLGNTLHRNDGAALVVEGADLLALDGVQTGGELGGVVSESVEARQIAQLPERHADDA